MCYIAIEMPILKTSLAKYFQRIDLTLNQIALPLSKVYMLDSIADMNASLICNALEAVDSLKDIQAKVLKMGVYHKKVIGWHSPMTHWWRVIKTKVKLNDFTIDDNLIRIHREFYPHWLAKKGYFEEEAMRKAFATNFHGYLANKKKRSYFEAFVAAIDEMQAKDALIETVNKCEEFRIELVRVLYIKTKFEDPRDREACVDVLVDCGLNLRES